ncbi:zinc finger protein 649 [Caerostris darwini]|uniref:Zinc finger protein 649 n=1 Tax=Caerostris darwini TaxID=1538125 RepID=A0AAV4VA74_9ARAC|nr:zinc finger protein 649 [Caerostris darwini]
MVAKHRMKGKPGRPLKITKASEPVKVARKPGRPAKVAVKLSQLPKVVKKPKVAAKPGRPTKLPICLEDIVKVGNVSTCNVCQGVWFSKDLFEKHLLTCGLQNNLEVIARKSTVEPLNNVAATSADDDVTFIENKKNETNVSSLKKRKIVEEENDNGAVKTNNKIESSDKLQFSMSNKVQSLLLSSKSQDAQSEVDKNKSDKNDNLKLSEHNQPSLSASNLRKNIASSLLENQNKVHHNDVNTLKQSSNSKAVSSTTVNGKKTIPSASTAKTSLRSGRGRKYQEKNAIDSITVLGSDVDDEIQCENSTSKNMTGIRKEQEKGLSAADKVNSEEKIPQKRGRKRKKMNRLDQNDKPSEDSNKKMHSVKRGRGRKPQQKELIIPNNIEEEIESENVFDLNSENQTSNSENNLRNSENGITSETHNYSIQDDANENLSTSASLLLTPLQPVKEENDEEKNDLQSSILESKNTSDTVAVASTSSASTSSDKDSNPIAFTCAECHRSFTRKYHLDRHLKISKCSGLPMPSFPCELCNRNYTRKDNLREHLRSHTGEVHRRKNHKCQYCDKAFHGQSLLAIHVRKHTGEKPFPCDFCPKRFPSTGALSKHRMTHTGEKPYSCNECGRKFTLKGTLSRHIRTHTGIRPHACTYCGKKFIQIGGLNAHMFYHTGENGFKCNDCGKVFNRKARLQMHRLYVHIKLKPFVCEHCNKPFTRKEDLMRHAVLHTGEKPFKCPTCERRFSVKPSLKLHLLTHTKEEPRSCHECGRAFIRKDCLLRHMRKRHRDVFDKLLFDDKDEKDASLVNTRILSEKDLTENIRELLYLLIDEPTLVGFGWPDKPVDEVLELVIQRCGHVPVNRDHYGYMDRLRENAKLLFTVVIDDNAVKTLLNNQTVDEVILHVLRLAKT